MKLISYRFEEDLRSGILTSDEMYVLPLEAVLPETAGLSLLEVIELYPDGLPVTAEETEEAMTADGALVPVAELDITAPIERPHHDVICVGVNYLSHMKESTTALKNADPEKPPANTIYFSKRVNKMTGPDAPVVNAWDVDDHMDYEVELAVIIGKGGRAIKKEEAGEHIFGYSVFNDVSARITQQSRVQWYMGKSMDTYSCMGPVILTADEVERPEKLEVISRVNGEERQHSNTELLIRDVGTLIEEVSSYFTLEPGDIIATGTPSGVALGMDEPLWLKPGDVVECEIPGIGILRNPIL